MQKNGAFGMNINKMNGNITIKMAKDLKGLESVTTKDAAGNTTVMNGGPISSMYVMQDELTQLKAENALMKQTGLTK